MKAIGWIVVAIAAYLVLTRRQQLDYSIPPTAAGAIASNQTFSGPPVASATPGLDAAYQGDTATAENISSAVSVPQELPTAVQPSGSFAEFNSPVFRSMPPVRAFGGRSTL